LDSFGNSDFHFQSPQVRFKIYFEFL
jgi:hypothetical protein